MPPSCRPVVLLVAVLFVLTSCALPGSASTVRSSTAPTSTPTPTRPTPTPTLAIPGPLPQNCPVSTPHPQALFTQLAPVIGASPVWATWPPGPSRYHLVLPSPPYPQNSNYEPGYGWAMAKVVWEVGPNYTHLVTVQGHDLFDHTPLLFQFAEPTPVADEVLDPQHPNHGPSVVNYVEWGSYIVAPKAGCYTMQVSWPAGRWAVTFAAGA
jgi:hypothetical protein